MSIVCVVLMQSELGWSLHIPVLSVLDRTQGVKRGDPSLTVSLSSNRSISYTSSIVSRSQTDDILQDEYTYIN